MEEKFNILVVDDDMNLASNLQDILEAAGYGAAATLNAETALALCRDKLFDLAIVDIKLPDISGIDLTRKLAGLSPETIFIIITGYASLGSVIEVAEQKHIIAYITKPIDMENLLSLIRVARDGVSSRKQ
jgi:ATP-dependent Lon protease